jgi:hypothetical protein
LAGAGGCQRTYRAAGQCDVLLVWRGEEVEHLLKARVHLLWASGHGSRRRGIQCTAAGQPGRPLRHPAVVERSVLAFACALWDLHTPSTAHSTEYADTGGPHWALDRASAFPTQEGRGYSHGAGGHFSTLINNNTAAGSLMPSYRAVRPVEDGRARGGRPEDGEALIPRLLLRRNTWLTRLQHSPTLACEAEQAT